MSDKAAGASLLPSWDILLLSCVSSVQLSCVFVFVCGVGVIAATQPQTKTNIARLPIRPLAGIN